MDHISGIGPIECGVSNCKCPRFKIGHFVDEVEKELEKLVKESFVSNEHSIEQLAKRLRAIEKQLEDHHNLKNIGRVMSVLLENRCIGESTLVNEWLFVHSTLEEWKKYKEGPGYTREGSCVKVGPPNPLVPDFKPKT